jgi:hypothetical protein
MTTLPVLKMSARRIMSIKSAYERYIAALRGHSLSVYMNHILLFPLSFIPIIRFVS